MPNASVQRVTCAVSLLLFYGCRQSFGIARFPGGRLTTPRVQLRNGLWQGRFRLAMSRSTPIRCRGQTIIEIINYRCYLLGRNGNWKSRSLAHKRRGIASKPFCNSTFRGCATEAALEGREPSHPSYESARGPRPPLLCPSITTTD